MEIKNAIVERVTLSNDDHGVLSAWLHLNYGGSGQGFGGYCLYNPSHEDTKNCCGKFIWRCLEICDVTEWSKIPGKTIRVRIEDGLAQAIGHIVKDDWFCPKTDME